MQSCDALIRNACVIDGSETGSDSLSSADPVDVAILDGRIAAMGEGLKLAADHVVDASGMILAPGFIDTHTHDDLAILRMPEMLPKLSQGVTTVIVGNCGISAAPVRLAGGLPDPMNLLGTKDEFLYPTFVSYIEAIRSARPAVNVASLVGHTALRNNHLDRLDRSATPAELARMCGELEDALQQGALGLSTGLAYLSATFASTEEVKTVAGVLEQYAGIYATHLRSETEAIVPAIEEAFEITRAYDLPLVISHLKCAGVDNWGRAKEVLKVIENARKRHAVAWDCYPYAAGSSTLDPRQVDERVEITITWSDAYPEIAGKPLREIAERWGLGQLAAAKRLMPAGAIYHSIAEDDMRRILAHPATMIGSDGLPCDPRPHPRLWGTFPRVLGKYCREEKLFPLREAIHKMTELPANTFGLEKRGSVRIGCFADLVLFDPEIVEDTATYAHPISSATGIEAVWVNGLLSYENGKANGGRAGRFLTRDSGSRTPPAKVRVQ